MTRREPDIVLHEWAISPFCAKVRKVLDLKGLPYRRVSYNGLRALKVRAVSPTGKLPVLEYDGERFVDSSNIARMLDERHPGRPILPADVDRHLAHLLEDWADESLYFFELWERVFDPVGIGRMVELLCEGRPRYERFFVRLALGRYRRALVAQGLGRSPPDEVHRQLRAHLDALEGRLQGTRWLAGPAPSIADIAVAAQPEELARTSPRASEVLGRPRLEEWLQRCRFGSKPAPIASAEPAGVAVLA
jgi:glutathione S-transferase